MTGGYQSMLAFSPETGHAVVALCAADIGEDIDKLPLRLLEQLQQQ